MNMLKEGQKSILKKLFSFCSRNYEFLFIKSLYMFIKLFFIVIFISLLPSIFSQENVTRDSLKIEPITDTIDVNGNLFKRNPSVNTGYTNVVFEEIHKTPGALEDVIKYFVSSI